MADSPTYPASCPECGAPIVQAEVSHFVEDAMPLAMAPARQPKPAAATYRCQRGHEFTWSLPRG